MKTRVALFVALAAMACSCGTQRPAAYHNPQDMVDVGYGTVDKRELTNAVTDLKPKGTEIEVYNNIYDYLRGRVPGLEVGQSDGGVPSITIRGKNSLNSSTEPLIMVDGMPTTDLNNVNPQDVYSVSVLKDSSASMYGVRGANGVILITTKSGRTVAEERAAALRAERIAAREQKNAAKGKQPKPAKGGHR